jgi:DNA-binding NarL/FixJ family response regulator
LNGYWRGRLTSKTKGPELTAVEAMKLKPKELQIIVLAADGLNASQIGEAMKLTPGTVGVYRWRAIEKLGADNLYHAIAIAFRLGILK